MVTIVALFRTFSEIDHNLTNGHPDRSIEYVEAYMSKSSEYVDDVDDLFDKLLETDGDLVGMPDPFFWASDSGASDLDPDSVTRTSPRCASETVPDGDLEGDLDG